MSSGITLSVTSWTPIGPAPIVSSLIPNGLDPGNTPVTGRIAAIAADPTNANTIYVAAAGGGVWKTTDGGTTWTPLTDNQATLSMGAIAVAPSNPNVIYAGTGEADNSIDSFYGRGILKSTNAGATWTLLSGNAGVNEFDRRNIAKIVVDPTNPNTVYVALTWGTENGIWPSSYGIFKSTDGGQTWTNTTASITTDPSAFFTDLVLDPTNPRTVYAAVGNFIGNAANGVYKSTDAGTTWSIAGNFPMGSNDGLIKLAIAPSAPQTLFASISDPSSGHLLEMLKTTDGGNTWTALTKTPNYLGNQGWYNPSLAVDPANANIVYAGGTNNGTNGMGTSNLVKGFLESTDGGNTWTDISTGAGNKTGPHVDHHAIAFDANGKLLDGNDGGIWRLDNADPKNVVWTDLNGNLNTVTFTGIALDPTNPNIAYGGSQDNGTEKFTGSLGWTQFGKNDGGFVQVDPSNPSTVYFTYSHSSPGWFLRSDDGGATTQSLMNGINPNDPGPFYIRFVLDASNPARLVLGTNRVYETTDRANDWTPISAPYTNGWNTSRGVTGLGIASGDPNTIYADVGSGAIFVTTDHGASWHERDIPGIGNVHSDIPPLGDIAVDPTNKAVAYVTVDKFSQDLGGSPGHVYRTSDYGQHWTDISGNLPDMPTSAIVLDSRTNTLYVGTDIGVYYSSNGGATWAPFQTGMPNVRVVDLELCPALNILAAGTHGRGMWEILVPGPSASSNASASPSIAGPSNVSVFNTSAGLIAGVIHLTTTALPVTPGSTLSAIQNGVITLDVPTQQLASPVEAGGQASNATVSHLNRAAATAALDFVFAEIGDDDMLDTDTQALTGTGQTGSVSRALDRPR